MPNNEYQRKLRKCDYCGGLVHENNISYDDIIGVFLICDDCKGMFWQWVRRMIEDRFEQLEHEHEQLAMPIEKDKGGGLT